MVRDKYTEIANESVRRLMDECIECMEAEEAVSVVESTDFERVVSRLVGPEQVKRLAAMNNAMARIIRSAGWN